MRVYKASGFIPGIIVGIGGLWLYHHFARPLPGAKSS